MTGEARQNAVKTLKYALRRWYIANAIDTSAWRELPWLAYRLALSIHRVQMHGGWDVGRRDDDPETLIEGRAVWASERDTIASLAMDHINSTVGVWDDEGDCVLDLMVYECGMPTADRAQDMRLDRQSQRNAEAAQHYEDHPEEACATDAELRGMEGGR